MHEAVVLLHGLGRTSRSMRRLDRVLTRRGYRVLNLGYPSRSRDIPTLARYVAARVLAWDGVVLTESLHFVTHSLGGIVVRAAVANGHFPRDRVGRVVMLGPPNTGSEVADALLRGRGVGPRILGPAGVQLTTSPDSYVARLPAVDYPVGVIAGSRSFNPLFSAVLGEANDGKVRIARTRVAGMTDFVIVPVWHPLLPAARVAIEHVVHFLQRGAFDGTDARCENGSRVGT